MPRSGPSDAARRNAALDGLRGIAALSVFAFHAWLYTLDRVRVASARDDSLGAHFAAELRIGLVLFFVLSGFLLFRPWPRAALAVQPWRAPRPVTYAVHRIGRIVPAYWLAIAGSVLLLWPLAGEPGVRLPPLEQLPLFFLFAQNLGPRTLMTLDPPMWTLAVEASFYLVLPLIGWLALRARPTRLGQAAAPLALLALGVAFNWWLAGREAAPLALSKTLAAMLPYFALGMLAAVLVAGRRPSRGAAAALLAGGAALVLLDGWLHASAVAGSELSQALRVWRDLPAAIGFAAIVAVCAERPPRALAARPLARSGELSYGLYLWHVPVLLWLRAKGLLPGGVVGAVLVGLPASLALAWLSWRLVERPAIRWSRRTGLLGANAERPAVSEAGRRSAGRARSRTRSSRAGALPARSGSRPHRVPG
ncbi:MAG: acyltransferase [Solirubrobacteraceae bacterium]|nr:acyltransferase [Solirubrobacteraceae bacterium]